MANRTNKKGDKPSNHSHKLTEDQKKYIVGCLARFEKPKTIRDNLKKIFKVIVSFSTIIYYDPVYLDKLGRCLSEDLENHFNLEREKYRTSIGNIPSANQSYRLEELHRMAAESSKKGNFVLASKLYEQIAKELGGMYIAKNFQHSINTVNNIVPHEDASLSDEQLLTLVNSAIASTNAGVKKEGTESESST